MPGRFEEHQEVRNSRDKVPEKGGGDSIET